MYIPGANGKDTGYTCLIANVPVMYEALCASPMEKDPIERAQYRISENKLAGEEAAVRDRENLQK